MPERAHVASIDALEAFRATLVVYLSKARAALEDISDDVVRLRLWLQSEQRLHWEREVRKRNKALEQAQQALFSAGLARLREATTAEHLAVQQARRALAEAEAKLRVVKQWTRDFDSRIEPLAKRLDHLRNLLAKDLPQGAAWLAQAIKTLDAYAGVAVPIATAGPSELDGAHPIDDLTAHLDPAHASVSAERQTGGKSGGPP